ncbi:sortase [Candidatus Gottesmanbacteria bacterium]|nr:sortase [Candidatus Gottesmanbacteria bacterium]
MAMYQYIKAPPRRPRTSMPIVISWMLMTSGVMVLIWTIWPIISFVVLKQQLLDKTISPIADRPVAFRSVGDVLPASVTSPTVGGTVDSTNANLWFPTSPQKKVVAPVNSYQLSIPKLKIKNATVIIAGDDLNKSLVHYGGTGLPGQYGNAVIFGHSNLPQFFSPTNYDSIFSLLPTLKVGDEIFVIYDGITYRYVVYDMVVTKPTDLSVLEQRYDDSYLTLVTCVPPGTLWERLDVKARLAQL